MISLLPAPRNRRRSALIAMVLACSIVWIGSLQYAPAAHAHIHDDAGEADHHCVVEVFNEGVLINTPIVSVSAPQSRIEVEHQLATLFHPETGPRLHPPGRAPPIG